jgi:hypothetical protein
MMYLYKYIGKKVKVKTAKGNIFVGRAIGVDDDDDNESGYYSLNIKLNKEDKFILDIEEPDIVSIEIIE